MLNIMKHLFNLRALFILGACSGALLSSQNCYAQDFTRTLATGQWRDGEWQTASSTDVQPPSFADAYVGVPLGISGVVPATVNVFEVETIANLFLGESLGGSGGVVVTTGMGSSGLSTGNLSVTSETQVRQGSLTVAAGATFSSNSLVIDGASSSATLSGTVSINSLMLTNGGALNVDANTVMDLDDVVIDTSTFTVNGNSNSTGNFSVDTGILNLNAGTLTVANELSLIDATVARSGGSLALEDLAVDGSTDLLLTLSDSIDGDVVISNGGEISFSQSMSDLIGITANSLTIDSGSKLSLAFDAVDQGTALDWGFRVIGDQSATMQAFLDDGRIDATGNVQPIEIFYDNAEYGDFTYVGFTAVPEPSSLAILAFVGCGAMMRRRRRG